VVGGALHHHSVKSRRTIGWTGVLISAVRNGQLFVRTRSTAPLPTGTFDFTSSTSMKHDLREDAKMLRKYIHQRLNDFSLKTNDGPGRNHDAVSLIHIGFENEQGGYVAIVFDTRPAAMPDGKWTMHIEGGNSWIEFPHWAECTESIFEEGSLELTLVNGNSQTFTEDSDEGFHAAFGEMIATEIQNAIDQGLFTALPRAEGCKIYIEEINGNYEWPDSEELPTV